MLFPSSGKNIYSPTELPFPRRYSRPYLQSPSLQGDRISSSWGLSAPSHARSPCPRTRTGQGRLSGQEEIQGSWGWARTGSSPCPTLQTSLLLCHFGGQACRVPERQAPLQERPERSLSRKSLTHRGMSLGNLWLGADQGSDSTPRPNEQP